MKTICVVVIFFGSLSLSLACMCQPQHPQDKFCNVAFVFKGKVLQKETIYSSPDGAAPAGGPPGPRIASEIRYRILAKPVFRNNSNTMSMVANQVVTVTTNGQQSMCGVTSLEEGNTYLVSALEMGNQLRIVFCGWTVPYSEVTPSQKKMLRGDYDRVCSQQPRCRLSMPCRAPNPSMCPRVDGCIFNYDDCKMKHSTCERNSEGTCGWHHYMRRYTKCLREERES